MRRDDATCHITTGRQRLAAAPWLPSTSKTQQNGYSLVAKRKPRGGAQGPTSVWSLATSSPLQEHPVHPTSSALLLTESPGRRISAPFCHLLGRGEREWGAGREPISPWGRGESLAAASATGAAPCFTRAPVPIGHLHPEHHHHRHVRHEGPASCKISQETPGAATVSQSVVTPRILAARQQPHTPSGAACRCPGPQ